MAGRMRILRVGRMALAPSPPKGGEGSDAEIKAKAGLTNSSPARGGGARVASDGGGSLPFTSFDADSPLQYAPHGPPPHSGEDLADAEIKAQAGL